MSNIIDKFAAIGIKYKQRRIDPVEVNEKKYLSYGFTSKKQALILMAKHKFVPVVPIVRNMTKAEFRIAAKEIVDEEQRTLILGYLAEFMKTNPGYRYIDPDRKGIENSVSKADPGGFRRIFEQRMDPPTEPDYDTDTDTDIILPDLPASLSQRSAPVISVQPPKEVVMVDDFVPNRIVDNDRVYYDPAIHTMRIDRIADAEAKFATTQHKHRPERIVTSRDRHCGGKTLRSQYFKS